MEYTIKFANVKKQEEYTHYLGRSNKTLFLAGSVLANPFSIKKESESESVLCQYQEWLDEKLNDPMGDESTEIDNLVNYLLENQSITLGCDRTPKRCHCEIVASYIYTRARDKYLASKIDASPDEIHIDVQTPQRGTQRASRGKRKPTPEDLALEWTRQKAESCSLCDLCDNRQHTVWSRGEGKVGLMIVGEAPGENEDKFALPFIGKSGKMLEVMLQSIGLESQRDCWIVNSVKCRPPLNADPTASQIKKCLPYLISQIVELKPKVILCVGKYSSQLLTGQDKFKISIHRGNVYQLDMGNYLQLEEPWLIPVVPTFHPAYLLRNPTRGVATPKYYAWKDLITVSKLLGE